MTYYQHHALICVNQRPEGKSCCNNHGTAALLQYAKQAILRLGLNGPAKVRFSQAGCLGRCKLGPVLVIYSQPSDTKSLEETWYTFQNEADIDRIIQSHCLGNDHADDLLLPSHD
jgi:(2Fe-2S) ferredoxin